MPLPQTIDERCVQCHVAVGGEILSSARSELAREELDQLWTLYLAIGRAWDIPEATSLRSVWEEFILAKTTTIPSQGRPFEGYLASPAYPSYVGEYLNALTIVSELRQVYPQDDDAYTMLFFRNGISPGSPPQTQLHHAKYFVVDEFIRHLIISGGFRSFVQEGPARQMANYLGYVAGTRYNRVPRVRQTMP